MHRFEMNGRDISIFSHLSEAIILP